MSYTYLDLYPWQLLTGCSALAHSKVDGISCATCPFFRTKAEAEAMIRSWEKNESARAVALWSAKQKTRAIKPNMRKNAGMFTAGDLTLGQFSERVHLLRPERSGAQSSGATISGLDDFIMPSAPSMSAGWSDASETLSTVFSSPGLRAHSFAPSTIHDKSPTPTRMPSPTPSEDAAMAEPPPNPAVHGILFTPSIPMDYRHENPRLVLDIPRSALARALEDGIADVRLNVVDSDYEPEPSPTGDVSDRDVAQYHIRKAVEHAVRHSSFCSVIAPISNVYCRLPSHPAKMVFSSRCCIVRSLSPTWSRLSTTSCSSAIVTLLLSVVLFPVSIPGRGMFLGFTCSNYT